MPNISKIKINNILYDIKDANKFSGSWDDLTNKPFYEDELGNIVYLDDKFISDNIARVSDVADLKDDLLNGAGEAYDTLKELGDLINENVDAIDALEAIAVNKADKSDIEALQDLVGETAVSEQIDEALNENAVLYNTAQTLSDEQKQQAQNNIGLVYATDEDVIDALVEADLLCAVTDADGNILTDESENILLW